MIIDGIYDPVIQNGAKAGRVPALIVADDIQDVSVMIGQPFINQTNVVLVVKDDQIRLFSSDILDLPQVDQLPPTKIKMMVTKDIVMMSDWVLSTQLMDNRCKYLHEVLSERPKDKEEELIHKDYTLKNNRVYKNTNDGPKWVVPKNARRAIVAYYHDMAGHFALDKTLSSLSQQYWFLQMRKYVERYIHTCIMCAYNKEPAGKRPGVLHPIEKIATPMDTLHVDHLGPFVKSTRGNSYLIVAVDGFTKYVFAKAVTSTKVGPLIKFIDEISEVFGTPRRIICDKGTCYSSYECNCKELN
ncbi:hypothetical protein NQ318_012535 [Aromia moschata]|uniref:RNA-directed DNA polymerase n=1 Tax=Aromia moschata TaxID=1265417 RepID=A0AAV8X8D4_9CUCU|nr:hypothetical protein NQ318_012535 [Aromia moschata]